MVEWNGQTVKSAEPEEINIVELYSVLYGQTANRIAQQVAAKEAELAKKLDAFADSPKRRDAASTCFADLPPSARARGKERLDLLAKEIADLKGQREPLEERLDTILTELQKLDRSLDQARKTPVGESDQAMAEAIDRVIDRIVCEFQPVPGGGKGRRLDSVPVRITVIPRAGTELEQRTYDLLEGMWVAPAPHKKQGHLP